MKPKSIATKVSALLLTVLLAIGVSAPVTTVSAQLVGYGEVVIEEVVIGEAITEEAIISNENIYNIFNILVDQIQAYLGDFYTMENFVFDFSEKIEDGVLLVDIDIHKDVALREHPAESSFVLGMQEAQLTTRSLIESDAVQATIDRFVHDASEMFYDSLFVTELFTAVFENPEDAKVSGTNAFTLYHRDVTPYEVIRVSVERVAELRSQNARVNADEIAFADGIYVAMHAAEAAAAAEYTMQPFSQRIDFHRLVGRDWAQIHYRCNAHRCGTTTGRRCPYFLPAIVPGTNCANFVSHALHRSGLPTSTGATVGWHPSNGTNWPSNHWMRTGFHNNGGVTTYMVQRGWFNQPTTDIRLVMAGSIMFWRTSSHVAFVTSGNQQHVYFAENGQRSDGNAGGSSSGNRRFDPNVISARFYVPNQQVLNVIP